MRAPPFVLALIPLALGAACTVAAPSKEAPAPAPTTTPEDASAPEQVDAAPADPCDAPISPPPAALGLDPFYTRHLRPADSIPVLASGAPGDLALRTACRIIRQMLAFRPDVREAMTANGARVAVMARSEKTTDIPEHRDLYTIAPGTDWNTRARGLGGTVERPATSCAEENLLCEPQDPWRGENILVHELAHGIGLLGVDFVDATFRKRLQAAFDAARGAGKWEKTYAATNAEEYWAEGVQDYFDDNLEAIPANGIHNEVNTRTELLAYDPALHALIAEVFGPARWKPKCP